MIRRIPPIVRERLGGLYQRGAVKYCDETDPVENWKKGIPLIEFLESLHHHQNAVEMGLEDEDHEAAVLWNMAGFMWTKWAIKKGFLDEVKGGKDLVAAYNAVVHEYGGVEVHNPIKDQNQDKEVTGNTPWPGQCFRMHRCGTDGPCNGYPRKEPNQVFTFHERVRACDKGVSHAGTC